jgi:hypothetical protein
VIFGIGRMGRMGKMGKELFSPSSSPPKPLYSPSQVRADQPRKRENTAIFFLKSPLFAKLCKV